MTAHASKSRCKFGSSISPDLDTREAYLLQFPSFPKTKVCLQQSGAPLKTHGFPLAALHNNCKWTVQEKVKELRLCCACSSCAVRFLWRLHAQSTIFLTSVPHAAPRTAYPNCFLQVITYMSHAVLLARVSWMPLCPPSAQGDSCPSAVAARRPGAGGLPARAAEARRLGARWVGEVNPWVWCKRSGPT